MSPCQEVTEALLGLNPHLTIYRLAHSQIWKRSAEKRQQRYNDYRKERISLLRYVTLRCVSHDE